jgi:hypothetical protein
MNTEKIGKVWNTPNTLIGLLTKGVFGRRKFKRVGEQQYEALLGSPFDKFMRKIGFAAITLGEVVLFVNGGVTKKRLVHEMAHVKQGRKWGILFLPLYLSASLWGRLSEGTWYASNHFEKDAEEREGHAGSSDVS